MLKNQFYQKIFRAVFKMTLLLHLRSIPTNISMIIMILLTPHFLNNFIKDMLKKSLSQKSDTLLLCSVNCEVPIKGSLFEIWLSFWGVSIHLVTNTESFLYSTRKGTLCVGPSRWHPTSGEYNRFELNRSGWKSGLLFTYDCPSWARIRTRRWWFILTYFKSWLHMICRTVCSWPEMKGHVFNWIRIHRSLIESNANDC